MLIKYIYVVFLLSAPFFIYTLAKLENVRQNLWFDVN
jgi:hypothetical protein